MSVQLVICIIVPGKGHNQTLLPLSIPIFIEKSPFRKKIVPTKSILADDQDSDVIIIGYNEKNMRDALIIGEMGSSG